MDPTIFIETNFRLSAPGNPYKKGFKEQNKRLVHAHRTKQVTRCARSIDNEKGSNEVVDEECSIHRATYCRRIKVEITSLSVDSSQSLVHTFASHIEVDESVANLNIRPEF